MTEASDYVMTLARRLMAVYQPHTHPRAVIVTGSVAEGASDFYSDLDFGLYYDDLPSDEDIQAANAELPMENWRRLGDRADGAFLEFFRLGGIECQVMHVTVKSFETELDKVLVELDVLSPLQKVPEGILKCIALHGADLIQQWQARAAAYPDALARAMVTKGLEIFPIWRLTDYLAPRDATIWSYENLVEGSYNILRILAGLNRVYFSSFQFKRMRHFTAKLTIAPSNLADRLESLFHTDLPTAFANLESLVTETVALVDEHMPDVDTAPLKGRLGARVTPWTPAANL